jgi:Holliday junction resolvasome RuvABC endonuclease subunit
MPRVRLGSRHVESIQRGAHVVGIDLSLRAAAACAIPFPWDHDLEKVRMLRAGYALGMAATAKERIERIAQLAHDISIFCLNVKACRIGIEDYAFSKSSAHQHQTFETGGALKVAVLELLDLEVYPITASTARKTLLGVVPRLGAGKTKPWVVRNVKRLGGPTEGWTDDEADAFVVANRVLADAGGIAMAFDGE